MLILSPSKPLDIAYLYCFYSVLPWKRAEPDKAIRFFFAITKGMPQNFFFSGPATKRRGGLRRPFFILFPI